MTENPVKRVLCEVYSRIVGYLRPVSDWNKGKQAEFDDRKTYEVKQDKEASDGDIPAPGVSL